MSADRIERVLVTGGAGYVGSHTCRALHEAGHQVWVLDDLSNGHADAVRWGPLHVADLADPAALAKVFADARPDAIVHFAGRIEVGESVREPSSTYRANITGTLALLDAARAHGCRHLVFSSSASVYGTQELALIPETAALAPLSPYGRSKLFAEQLLADYGVAYGLRWFALRYFNAAGADPDGLLGERHHPETHLIPLVLAAAAGDRPALTIFGSDWPTPDRTCVRDYVHVADLADAHVRALRHLAAGGASGAANLGVGRGYSVREVIAAVERVTGRTVPVELGARRPGDCAVLVADPRRARELLGWQPRWPDLDAQVAHAWAWYQR